MYRDDDHVIEGLAKPRVFEAVRRMIDETTQGLHVIGTARRACVNMYSEKEIKNVGDIKGLKVRVQATATEDTMFPAYGAQTVHMPFGSVYASLQTGIVSIAENSVNVYLVNKHYEVAPVLNLTQHEANNALVFVSDKAWQGFSDEQKKWVLAAANEVSSKEPAKAFELERTAAAKLKSMGVKIVDDVDLKSLNRDRRSLSRQARQAARPARGEDQGSDPGSIVSYGATERETRADTDFHGCRQTGAAAAAFT